MTVDMMHIRHVRMRMLEPAMRMEMSVRLTGRFRSAMLVSMMFIVRMRMRMGHRLVNVFVPVSFGEVQPNAHSHESSCCEQLDCDGLTEHHDGG